MIPIAIVILNWNGKKHLSEFLPSVVKNTPNNIADIYVIDNGSTDDSILFLQTNFPTVIIVKNATNGGFAKGYNDGLKQINATYYLLLNSDVEVTENWLTPLYNCMQNSNEIAACQPKILSYKNKHLFEHAGAAGGYIDKFGYPFCRGRLFDVLEEDNGQYDDDVEIFWATGACILINANLFIKAKGFDESFFAHMEEIDLCWRLKNEGYKIAYVSASKVYHLGGGTLSVISPNKTYLNFRNNLYLLYKNLPDKYFHRTLLVRFILDIIAAIRFVSQLKTKHAYAIIRAYLDSINQLKTLREKRKQLKLNHKKEYLSGVYLSSLVWDFYIQRIKKFYTLDINKISK